MATNYIATAVDFTTVADAIRAKGGTSASLSWPAGFAAAISAIQTSGGGDEVFNQMVTRTYSFASPLQVVSTSYVGSGAFAWFRPANIGLSFPNATTISDYAFHGASFEQLTFPNCTTIGNHAFNNYQDDNITFTKMSVVPSYAFYSASFSTMTDSMFPSATIVQSSACRYARLTTISMSKIVSAYQYAFANCTALTNVSLPSLKGTLGIAAFTGCTTLTTITLPNIGILNSAAFQGCTSLTAVYLPKCTKISSTYAFRSCYHLLSLYLLNSTMATLTSTTAFTSTPISTYTTSTGGVQGSIYVPSNLLASYQAATNWKTYSARFVGLTSAEIAALGF